MSLQQSFSFNNSQTQLFHTFLCASRDSRDISNYFKRNPGYPFPL